MVNHVMVEQKNAEKGQKKTECEKANFSLPHWFMPSISFPLNAGNREPRWVEEKI